MVDGRVHITGGRYRETGRLRMAGHEGPFHRDYLVRFPDPWRAEILFEDGRPFHDLDLRAGTWAVRHQCGGDLYEGRFSVDGGSALRVAWRVVGPRKDLRIRSRLEAVYANGKGC